MKSTIDIVWMMRIVGATHAKSLTRFTVTNCLIFDIYEARCANRVEVRHFYWLGFLWSFARNDVCLASVICWVYRRYKIKNVSMGWAERSRLEFLTLQMARFRISINAFAVVPENISKIRLRFLVVLDFNYDSHCLERHRYSVLHHKHFIHIWTRK